MTRHITWDRTHNPEAVPLGCNGKAGDSGRKVHKRKGEAPCARCRRASNHAKRERNRGQGRPRQLQPCGTPAAARRHRFRGEPLDFACRIAEAQGHADNRAARRALPS